LPVPAFNLESLVALSALREPDKVGLESRL
jgi:hypothetical protein